MISNSTNNRGLKSEQRTLNTIYSTQPGRQWQASVDNEKWELKSKSFRFKLQSITNLSE